MSWARYDDMFPMNRKVSWLRARGLWGLAAIGLHVLVNTWSRHEGAGGHIPSYVVEQMAGRHGRKLAQHLYDCGMFEPADDGWQIHDYDQYGERGQTEKPATARKADLSEKRAAAGRKGGSKPKANSQANQKQSGSPEPEPEPCLKSSEQQQLTARPAELAAAAAETFALIVDIREHQQWSRIGDHTAWRRAMARDVPVEYGPTVWSALVASPTATAHDVASTCGFAPVDIARAMNGAQ